MQEITSPIAPQPVASGIGPAGVAIALVRQWGQARRTGPSLDGAEVPRTARRVVNPGQHEAAREPGPREHPTGTQGER